MTIACIVLALLLVAAICHALLKWRTAGEHASHARTWRQPSDARSRQTHEEQAVSGIAVSVFRMERLFIRLRHRQQRDFSNRWSPSSSASVSRFSRPSLPQALCDEVGFHGCTTLGELLGASMALSRPPPGRHLATAATHLRLAAFPDWRPARQMAGDDDPLLNLQLPEEFVFDYLATAGATEQRGGFDTPAAWGLGHVLEAVTGETTNPEIQKGAGITGMQLYRHRPRQRQKALVAQGTRAGPADAPIWTDAALAGAGA